MRSQDQEPGSVVGPYVLDRCIGEGGFGRVWLAEQSQPVRRHVALKILKAGMDTEQVVRRFEAERQALARMDHPCIAKVFDAGATERGRPYFVMEYIEGKSITVHCDDEHLSPGERLRLFREVCLGVQHAHQRGIVHRDIKPSNVMVTIVDGKPVPKIIDFGIVKAVDRPLTDRSIVTEVRQIIGTPEYMAPEQADGRGDVDTRADVYSLGVLLYELLTGTKPFELTSLMEQGYDEVLRHIREVDPARPSTRVSSLGARVEDVASLRSQTPRSLRRLLRGDLDWIVLKALEKDRERRYGSAAELADEIARYLADEPVAATPPSALYRLGKFARRNRALVVSGIAIACALVAAVAILSWSLARVSDERDAADLARVNEGQARREAEHALADRGVALEQKRAALLKEETARQHAEQAFSEAAASLAESDAVTEFLSVMLASADPWQVGRDVTVREILDRSTEDLAEHFIDQPRIELRLRETIGRAYRNLGLIELAEEHLPRALQLARSTLNPDDERCLSLLNSLAQLREDQGRFDEAERLSVELLERARAVGDERKIAWALATIALVHGGQGRYEQAQSDFPPALAAMESAYGAEHENTLQTQLNYAVLLAERGHDIKAAPIMERLVEAQARKWGLEHPNTLAARHNRAIQWERQGRLAEAEAESRAVLASRRRVFGDAHPATIASLLSLGIRLRTSGRYAEAEVLLRDAVESSRRAPGARDELTGHALRHLGLCLWLAGRPAEAKAPLQEALELHTGVLAADHPDILEVRNVLAIVQYVTGQLEQARESWELLTAQQLALYGEDDAHVNRTKANLAMVYADLARHDEAELLYREALESFRRSAGPEAKPVLDIMNNLGNLYLGAGRFEEAYDMISEIVDLRTRLLGAAHPLTLGSRGNLAIAMVGLDQGEDALAILTEVLAAKRSAVGAGHPSVGQTLLTLGSLRLARGELDLAQAHAREAERIFRQAYEGAHPSILDALQLVGEICLEAGRASDAVPILSEALEGREDTLGAEHPKTLATRDTLERARAASDG